MTVQNYLKCDAGATAMIYALCLLPLLAGIGFALDVSRGVSAKSAVQSSLDASVLASTRDIVDATLSDAEVIARAQAYFMADVSIGHTGLECAPAGVVLDRNNFQIEVTADCDLPTTVGGLMGVEAFEISETAKAKVNVTKLDLALMVDVSGSMSGSKMDALKLAAKDAINELIRPETGKRVRVAIAPYNEAVNVDGFSDDVLAPGFGSEICASERTGDEAFTAAEPKDGQWIETVATSCPSAPIQPLTHKVDDLEDAIDNLNAGGMTAGHLGIAWARYLIAPEWSSVWPSASDPLPDSSPANIKAVILMTDGAFNTEYEPLQGDSNTQAEALCDQMKADGVLIFSVAFQAPSAGEAILQTCASSPDKYFDASSKAQLREAYKSIASSLSDLRLTN